MPSRRRKHLLDKYAHLPFFAQWSHDDLIRMDRAATELEFEPGEIISRDVMSGQEFVVLVVGHAIVNGGRTNGLAVVPGDHLGELAMFTDSTDKAVLIADTYCRALVLSGSEFRSLLHTTPSLGRVLSGAMARKLNGVLHPQLPVQRPALASAGRTRL
jgi:CRP-like cAMP-binding protein